MAELDLADFRGGVKHALASTEFSERQWAELSGVMFGPDGRLEAQWASWQVDDVADVGRPVAADGWMVGVQGGLVRSLQLADDDAEQSGSGLTSHGEAPNGRTVTTVPAQVDGAWLSAALVNTVEPGEPARLVYRDPSSGAMTSQMISERYPPDPETAGLPYGRVAATWGDFLLLGDVRWMADDGQPLSEENSTRRSDLVWFSEPARNDSWDSINVQPVGNADGENRVVGMFPLDIGLLVTTTSGVYLLRGNADEYGYEELRLGIGPQEPEHVCYWPAAGAVVWTDAQGRVWHTNGEQFDRLDDPLDPAGVPGPVEALHDHLFVGRGDDLWVFRLDGAEGSGAWTRLTSPAGAGAPEALVAYRTSLYVRADGGLWRLSAELGRGAHGGAAATSRVGTATLAVSDGHTRAGWHRFGARSTGGGQVVRATARPSPWLAGPGPELVYDEPLEPDVRTLRVWPAHGPSLEASFGVEAEGDVSFEGLTVWVHAGKADR